MVIEGINQMSMAIGVAGIVTSISFGFFVMKNRLNKFDEYSKEITGRDVDKLLIT